MFSFLLPWKISSSQRNHPSGSHNSATAPAPFRAALRCSVILALLLASGSACIATDAPSMTTSGQLSVNSRGAAVYSIPIEVPPGTAGLVPNLSLNYSSESGNGYVGFGWSLGGLPTITRCAQTVAQDGAGHYGSVTYKNSDRFCLDGERLLLKSGTYGVAGSEYRTEIESFTKVVAHGTQGTGPSYFSVYTKDGQVLELGNPANGSNAQILATGKTEVRVWAVNKISDYSGNYLAVFYHVNASIGEYYPDHIFYTGNDGAGLQPYSSVYFKYFPRVDVTPVYHAGSQVEFIALLTDINTYRGTTETASNLVSHYKLNYDLGNSPYSQLTWVQRCSDSAATVCLPKTTFTWQTASTWPTRIVVEATPEFPAPNQVMLWPGVDFNGDGLLDGIGFTNVLPQCVPVLLGTGTGWIDSGMTMMRYGLSSPQPACLAQGSQFAPNDTWFDIDGDGLEDISSLELFPDVCWCIVRNDGQGHFLQLGSNTALQFDFNNPATMNGDFNGDGRGDASGYNFNTGTIATYFGNGDGTFAQSIVHIGGDGDNTAHAIPLGDFDGDGCLDNLLSGNALHKLILASACAPAVDTISDPQLEHFSHSGDFNGDGLTDFFTVGATFGILKLSTGTSFAADVAIPDFNVGTAPNVNQFFVGDYDGDGKADVLVVGPHGFGVYTWTGTTLSLALTVSKDLPQPYCNYQCVHHEYNGYMQTADVDGDGCTNLVVWQPDMTVIGWYYKFACRPPLLINAISNGIGATTTIQYGKLNDNAALVGGQPFYTKCPGASPPSYSCGDPYPTRAIDSPIYVVKQVDRSNGLGGSGVFTSTYTYGGAKTDLSGRGFLGFSIIAENSAQTGVLTTTTYNQQFPFTGTIQRQTSVAGSRVLSDLQNTYGSSPATPVTGTPTFVFLAQTVANAQEVDGKALPTTTTSYMNGSTPGYDAYGSITHMSVSVAGGVTQTTDNTYCNLATACDDDAVNKWIIGKLTRTVVASVLGTSAITRTSSFSYKPANGVVNQAKIEPDSTSGCGGNNTSCKLATDYSTIDAFGHSTVVTLSGAGFASRTSSRIYDTKGEFVISAKNAKNQTEAWTYTDATHYPESFGVPATHTDLNSKTTTWTYDSFGRAINEVRQDIGSMSFETKYEYCTSVPGGTASCPSPGAFAVTVTPKRSAGSQAAARTITYYDALLRKIGVDVEGYHFGTANDCTSPCWARQDIVYDENGYVSKTSRSYYVVGGTPKWITNLYNPTGVGYPAGDPDPYGRPWKIRYPDNTFETYAYAGLANQNGTQTTFTDRRGKSTVTRKGEDGLVSSVTDALGKKTSYTYDALGHLLQVTDPTNHNSISNTYDLRGNKVTMDDPDMGSWSYTYDALGELLAQTDSKGQLTSLSYDLLGRLIERDEADEIATWTYDTAANGVGKLYQATAKVPGAGSNYYVRTHAYGTDGYPSSTEIKVNGTPYTFAYTWHGDNRVANVTYPSGFTAFEQPDVNTADLAQIYDGFNGPTQGHPMVWEATKRDAERRIALETAGNAVTTVRAFDADTDRLLRIRAGVGGDSSIRRLDYTFDAVGNLTSRTDTAGSYTENFCYDDVNRLLNYAVGASGSTDCTVAKSGFPAKSMTYDNDTGNIATKSDLAGGVYTYPAAGANRPHAVTSIAGTVKGVVNPKFKYDQNGNLTCVYTGTNCNSGQSGVSETVAWTAANMVGEIDLGAATSTFAYDSEHVRLTQHIVNGLTVTDTTYLFDPVTGAASEVSAIGTSITWRDYLSADGQLVGVRTCTTAVCTSPTWNYFVRDHLDSVATITNASGAVISNGQLSYDAWGQERNVDGSDNASCTLALGFGSVTTRKFTSQEAVPAFCLTNLNARIYDPATARFMSPDSIVPDPLDGAAYNRYSYVNNRPVSLIDPTGHDGNIETVTVYGNAMGLMANFGLMQNLRGLNSAMNWLQGQLMKMGARNITVKDNGNGSIAIDFTCSSGNQGCAETGQSFASSFGGDQWSGASGADVETDVAWAPPAASLRYATGNDSSAGQYMDVAARNYFNIPVRPDPRVPLTGVRYVVLPQNLSLSGGSTKITPYQQYQLAMAVQTVLNGAEDIFAYLALYPHSYANREGYYPGIPGAGGYTAYDVDPLGFHDNVYRLVVNTATGDAYFSVNHYENPMHFVVQGVH